VGARGRLAHKRHCAHRRLQEKKHFHCLNLDSGLVIDAGRVGSDARFLNHSCAPNCVIEKWSVLGMGR
jgi:SET domain-containing protein